MSSPTYLAEGVSHQGLTATLFIVVVLITVGITFWASRQTRNATDYGGRTFTGAQNGLAVSGDYMSAASFLGISGAIALASYQYRRYTRSAIRLSLKETSQG